MHVALNAATILQSPSGTKGRHRSSATCTWWILDLTHVGRIRSGATADYKCIAHDVYINTHSRLLGALEDTQGGFNT